MVWRFLIAACAGGLLLAQTPPDGNTKQAVPIVRPLSEVHQLKLQNLELRNALLQARLQVLQNEYDALHTDICATAGIPKTACVLNTQTGTVEHVATIITPGAGRMEAPTPEAKPEVKR